MGGGSGGGSEGRGGGNGGGGGIRVRGGVFEGMNKKLPWDEV